jgi:hypothetical protein
MWHRVARVDIEQARESLGHRLAETLKRHAEEINTVRAKHADELQVLEAKQIELNTLDAMIDRVAAEFLSAAAHGTDQNSTETPDGGDAPVPQAEIVEPASTGTSVPEALAVRYMGPSFRPFRRFAS